VPEPPRDPGELRATAGAPVDGRASLVLGGRYRLGALLGRGAMGAVYRGQDLAGGPAVAVKVLDGAGAVDEELLARFEREAEVLARVDRGGGVVRVHAAGRDAGLAWYAMQLVEGADLEAHLDAGLPRERLLVLLEALARTIARCHAAGVVHRDLKPANVLVRGDDEAPLVADFGLAADLAARARLTKTGDVYGTPAYMAPEQAAGGSPTEVGPAADVYALGAILYRALAGRPPFTGRRPQVLHGVLFRAPDALATVAPGVGADLVAICERALAKDPRDRYPSAEALAEDLARARRGEEVAARPIGALRRFQRRLARGDSRARLLAAGAAGALLVAAIVGAVALERDRRARARAASTAGGAAVARLLDWRLGLGSDAPPPLRADEARRLAGQLAWAAEVLDGPAAAEAARREADLAAFGRVLGDDSAEAPGPGAAAPPDRLAAAWAAYRDGRGRRARELAERLAADPAAGAVRPSARLLELAAAIREPPPEGLFAWVADHPLGWRGRRLAGRAAALLDGPLRRGALEALGRLPAAGEAGLEELRAADRAAAAVGRPAAAPAGAKVAALEAAAPRWEPALRGALRSGRRAEVEEHVALLRDAVGVAPRVRPGPALRRALGAACAAAGAGTTSPDDRAFALRLMNDVYYLCGVDPAPDALRTLLQEVLGYAHAGERPDLDAVLAALRCDDPRVPGSGRAHVRALAGGDFAAARELVTQRASQEGAWSQALVFLEVETFMEPADYKRWPAEEVAALLARAEVAARGAGLASDLAPRHRGDLWYEVAKLSARLADQTGARPYAWRAARAARRARGLLPPFDAERVYDTFHVEVDALRLLERPGAITRLWREAEALFRARFASARSVPALQRDAALRSVVRLARALEGEGARDEAIATLRRALPDADRLAPGDDTRLEVRGRLMRYLFDAGRVDEAEAALAPVLADGLLHHEDFGDMAVRVALARGERAEARRRLEVARAELPEAGRLRELERELGGE